MRSSCESPTPPPKKCPRLCAMPPCRTKSAIQRVRRDNRVYTDFRCRSKEERQASQTCFVSPLFLTSPFICPPNAHRKSQKITPITHFFFTTSHHYCLTPSHLSTKHYLFPRHLFFAHAKPNKQKEMASKCPFFSLLAVLLLVYCLLLSSPLVRAQSPAKLVSSKTQETSSRNVRACNLLLSISSVRLHSTVASRSLLCIPCRCCCRRPSSAQLF